MYVGGRSRVDDPRVRSLNDKNTGKGDYLLYWMQQSQRADNNHALEFSVRMSNACDVPLLVVFFLIDGYPGANMRHYKFMLEGLPETAEALSRRGLQFELIVGDPVEELIGLSNGASMVVTDRGYLRHQREWRIRLAGLLDRPFIEVDSDVVVPVTYASTKEEYSAATLRRKLRPLVSRFLKLPERVDPRNSANIGGVDGEDPNDIEGLRSKLKGIELIPPSPLFKGGASEARRRLVEFIGSGLDMYPEKSNDPSQEVQSNLSPYLHFGQISPVEVAMEVLSSQSPGREEFLEQLIVRRELAVNFCRYNPGYDSIGCLPAWAERTLEDHSGDQREYLYNRDELERGETHDIYWNAAQREMVLSGKMHGYMRMYWGKKVLEWSGTPAEAYGNLIYLNDRYSLDGRDPNGYAGVAWCFGKHDRPWNERPIFGKVRYMNDKGLERKFRIGEYVKKVKSLEDDACTNT